MNTIAKSSKPTNPMAHVLRHRVITILGLICTASGVWLRLAAQELAWPLEWGYSGPREDTVWAIRERAYEDLSLAILGFGLLLLIIVLAQWLWTPVADAEKERQA